MKLTNLIARIRGWKARIFQIVTYAGSGLTILDKIKMAVVGYARGHTFDSRGIISWAGRALFPSIKICPRTLGGLTIELNPSDISHLVAVDEVLFQDVYQIDQVPFKPDFVIDCGANIGVFTLLAASHFPAATLVAFEPDPKNLEWLNRQKQTNKLSIDVINAAVSDADGSAEFTSDLGIASALGGSHSRGGSVISVKTIRLAEYVSNLRSQRLVLKIDVEGAEEAIVPDIADSLPATCAIFFETHDGERSWKQIADRLSAVGFRVEIVRERTPYFEGFALRNSAVLP